jgi:hypothetical protein
MALVVNIKPDKFFNLRNFFREGRRHDHGGPGSSEGLPTHDPIDVQPVNPVAVFMVPVVAYFFEDEHKYQNGAGQSDGQSGYIDQSKNLILTDVSKRDSKEIPPHMFILTPVKTVFVPQSLRLWQ